MNKEAVFDSLTKMIDPITGKRVVAKQLGNLLEWDISNDKIAPWKNLSMVEKFTDKYIVHVVTIPFTTILRPTDQQFIIHGKIIFDDSLLRQNKLYIQIYYKSNQTLLKTINVYFNIGKGFTPLVPVDDDMTKLQDQLGEIYTEYGIYPAFTYSFFGWIMQMFSELFAGVATSPITGGSSSGYINGTACGSCGNTCGSSCDNTCVTVGGGAAAAGTHRESYAHQYFKYKHKYMLLKNRLNN